MPQFTDLCNRSWTLALNFRLAQEIRDALGVDFLNAHNGKALTALGRDDELLVKTLWMLCEAQAEKCGLSPEDFAEGLAGEPMEAACQAIEEAVVLFTRPAKRPELEAVRQRAAEVLKTTSDLTVRKVKSGRVDRFIEKKLARAERQIDLELDRLEAEDSSTASSSAASGPASPGSIPTRTP
jgi:hypothetical protein